MKSEPMRVVAQQTQNETTEREEVESATRASAADGERWRVLAIQCLALLAFLNGALAFYAFQSMRSLKSDVEMSLSRSEQRFQALESQVRFDSRRRHLLLGMRDEILRTNPELELEEAYRYASAALATTEKYVSVDPLLLVAVGKVESGYKPLAVSKAGARGLYQIYPATGRLLANALGWEYSDELLLDPEKNTEMAGLYLETLFSAYNDPTLVLAEYNGGPLNAGYLRAGARALARETKEYVPKVLKAYEQLAVSFGDGPATAGEGSRVGAIATTKTSLNALVDQ